MKKKIIITAGGTGGHVFPAIALGKQLSLNHQVELLYVGGNLGINPYFEKDTFAHQSISSATIKKKTPWSLIKSGSKIAWGIRQSIKILKDFKPDLIVGFGSYYTLPVLAAAKFKKVPFILHEANSVPGKVNRLLSKYARAVGIHFPSTATQLQGKCYEVGLPLRPGYRKGACSKKQALQYFELEESRLTMLVFGGSQGAVHLNHLVCHAMTNHSSSLHSNLQIIHIVGDSSLNSLIRAAYNKAGIKACVKPFENRMDLAWMAADFSIARAGAGTIAEQMEFEVPGILIPFPYATDNHQDTNADFLVKDVGGAIKYRERDLTPEILAHVIESFSHENRQSMGQAIHAYKLKNRTRNFCDLVLESVYT